MADGITKLTKEQRQEFLSKLLLIKKRHTKNYDKEYEQEWIDRWKRHDLAEKLGRLLIHFSLDPLTFLSGVTLLGYHNTSINDLGHSALHGAYKNSSTINDMKEASLSHKERFDPIYEANFWHKRHNLVHHKDTNILDKDGDLGEPFLRIVQEQPWRVHHIFQTIYLTAMLPFIKWGEINVDLFEGELSLKDKIKYKCKNFLVKNYFFAPLAGIISPLGIFNIPKVILGNLLADAGFTAYFYSLLVISNHFTEECKVYDSSFKPEDKAEWFISQIESSQSVTCENKYMQDMFGRQLLNQIEHHCFPNVPGEGLEKMAPEIEELCKEYGIKYNKDTLLNTSKSVYRRLFKTSFPAKMVNI